MTGEPARGPRGEGVGTEEIPGRETGKAGIRAKPVYRYPGQLSFLNGLFAGQFAVALLHFQSCQNKSEVKDLLLFSAERRFVHIQVSLKSRCMAGSLSFKLLPKKSTAKHFLKRDQKSRSGCSEALFIALSHPLCRSPPCPCHWSQEMT